MLVYLLKTDYDAKITETDDKIPRIIGLATSVVLNGSENKLPNSSNLVQKTDFDTKMLCIKSKYITTDNYKKLLKILLPIR